jgi:G:T-mismatch repair DNA endonuclease (very short patch repair protein)
MFNLVARKLFLLVQCFKYEQNGKILVVCRASWHEYLLALQPDLVVPGKRTVLSVEPCHWLEDWSLKLVAQRRFLLVQCVQYQQKSKRVDCLSDEFEG